ncbi:ATP-dependent sacrificial sulfur transferase LarE [Parasutterella secunda]|uniref:ATP-dependent sacrificial sulfur transferase LarE n=1 Tax=Parasutterella secunda TaxID=626947 RepID=UPI0021ACA6A6|nr:ATP-dependent sacrificial sulfur transferase LarE [Parasutterella secunda]MCR8920402.1 ATP-dependent sacrificial sulfur transferase LarE [Parasutterella secunda]
MTEPVMVAFSGGADSVLVLKLALEASRGRFPIYALYADAPWMPRMALVEAEQIARDLQVKLEVININSPASIGIENNPQDRCYRCKKAIFKAFMDFGQTHNVKILLEGTQLDDLTKYRPGLKAIAESGARSPLKELGLHKSDVRKLLTLWSLSASKKPSGSCLATRLPYGQTLSVPILNQIDQAENCLRSFGLGILRVRSHGDIARIETDPEYFSFVLSKQADIVRKLKSLGWKYVTLDLEGFRSGSMD